jgi:hypothetical protein
MAMLYHHCKGVFLHSIDERLQEPYGFVWVRVYRATSLIRPMVEEGHEGMKERFWYLYKISMAIAFQGFIPSLFVEATTSTILPIEMSHNGIELIS